MKKLTYLFGLGLLAATLFTSCDPEEDALPPSLTITSDTEVTAEASSSITIAWRADAGDAKLATVSISRDGSSVTGWIDVEIPNDQNETYIDQAVLTVPAAETVTNYTVTVTDRDGNSATGTVAVTVTVTEPLESIGTFQLGAGGSSLGSYFSVADEMVYNVAGAKANPTKIDIIFTSTASVATFISPKDAAASEVAAAGRTTLYKVVNYGFEDATSAQIEDESLSAEEVSVIAGDVVVFETQDGDRGIFVIDALTVSASGNVTIEIKLK